MKTEIFLVMCLLAIVVSITYLLPSSLMTIQEIGAEKVNLEFNDQLEHKVAFYNLVEGIATEVANSKEYELHVYDCTDFSRELAIRLQEEGFNAYCVFGKWDLPEYKLHTWVEINMVNSFIEVESTGGYIIPEHDFQAYTIKSKGKCL